MKTVFPFVMVYLLFFSALLILFIYYTDRSTDLRWRLDLLNNEKYELLKRLDNINHPK